LGQPLIQVRQTVAGIGGEGAIVNPPQGSGHHQWAEIGPITGFVRAEQIEHVPESIREKGGSFRGLA
jgi:hypothetical protein